VSGVALAALALSANAIGVGTTPGFGWKKSVLLVVGGELVLAGLIASTTVRARIAGHSRSTGPPIALGLCYAIIGSAFVASSLILFLGQTQAVERLGYVFDALVVVPLAITLSLRQGWWSAGEPTTKSLWAGVLGLSATALAFCVARELWSATPGGVASSLVLTLAIGAIAACVTAAAQFAPPRATGLNRATLVALPVILVVAALPFVPSPRFTSGNLAIAALVAAGVCLSVASASRLTTRARRIAGTVPDIIMPLVIVCMTGFLAQPIYVSALNQNYFLGPVSDVLHGHPMLVSTFSQYGVAMFDILGAFFRIVPIGYGTFTLLLSALTVLLYLAIYVILRWSTGSGWLAAAGVAVAAALNLYAPPDFYTSYPSTGVLRFGLAWLVILTGFAAARATGRRHTIRQSGHLVVVGLAAIWSAEAGAYCLGAALAWALYGVVLTNGGWRERLRLAARRTAALLGAYAGAILAFSIVTAAASGVWPHWGTYLKYLSLYTVGGFGALPILPWSPGLALGALYVVSATVLLVIAIVRPPSVERHALALRAAAALTVFGALAYTYYLGRAHPDNLEHVSPPAVALLFVWLGLIRSAAVTRGVRALSVASTVAVGLFGGLVVASQVSSVSYKFPTTLLGELVGVGGSRPATIDQLASNPVVNPGVTNVTQFVRTLHRGRFGLTIVLSPPIETESLIRLGEGNAVGASNPCQESLAPTGAVRVLAAVRVLNPGGTLVVSTPADAAALGALLPIQTYTLQLLATRFKLRLIASQFGVEAFQLERSRARASLRAVAAPAPTTNSFPTCA
jgi:hypothetical protein